MGYVLLAPILAPLAQDPCLPVEANVFRDPHVSFAFGGTADFRGRHKVIYNFLSTPDFAVNADGGGRIQASQRSTHSQLGRFFAARVIEREYWA